MLFRIPRYRMVQAPCPSPSLPRCAAHDPLRSYQAFHPADLLYKPPHHAGARRVHLPVGIQAGNILVRENQMVRTYLGRYRDANRFCLADQAYGLLCAHMAYMVMYAGGFCQQYVPSDMDCFRLVGYSFQAVLLSELAFSHASPLTSESSSQCAMTGMPSAFAWFMASFIICAFCTPTPSSVNPIAPALQGLKIRQFAAQLVFVMA